MSDDARNLGKAQGKAAQHDEPTDEVEAHGRFAGKAEGKAEHNKPGMTDELAGDENEVEAHLFKQQGKAAGKAE